jgi:hypothetical protein
VTLPSGRHTPSADMVASHTLRRWYKNNTVRVWIAVERKVELWRGAVDFKVVMGALIRWQGSEVKSARRAKALAPSSALPSGDLITLTSLDSQGSPMIDRNLYMGLL